MGGENAESGNGTGVSGPLLSGTGMRMSSGEPGTVLGSRPGTAVHFSS